ncbi:hypothetical protein L218DRAFT_951084 [Marasmius fiardii PR-910]|nr:hypothetical protein L218DRAFT_951084 [Marasmius fiardii PR-910]
MGWRKQGYGLANKIFYTNFRSYKDYPILIDNCYKASVEDCARFPSGIGINVVFLRNIKGASSRKYNSAFISLVSSSGACGTVYLQDIQPLPSPPFDKALYSGTIKPSGPKGVKGVQDFENLEEHCRPLYPLDRSALGHWGIHHRRHSGTRRLWLELVGITGGIINVLRWLNNFFWFFPKVFGVIRLDEPYFVIWIFNFSDNAENKGENGVGHH